MSISRTLKNWYFQNKRELPWRNTSDPYLIWISEVILQQTRVAQGLPYYYRFIETFPSIRDLAEAPEKSLLKIWQGLGYYSRARNLQQGAQYVLSNFKGILPANYEQLMEIKGVGEYTASAIASIAFNLPYPVVDGNVNRVLARVMGVLEPVNSNSGKKIIREYAKGFLDSSDPGIFNQAIMEFGALQCIPKNPDCSICPLNTICYAFKHGLVEYLPVKLKSSRMQKRYFYYLVISYNNMVYIRKRNDKDIWYGLFDFPLIETQEKISLEELMDSKQWLDLFSGISKIVDSNSVYFTHQLSHQKIFACFIRIQITDFLPDNENMYIKIDGKDFEKYPVSRLVNKYFEEFGL